MTDLVNTECASCTHRSLGEKHRRFSFELKMIFLVKKQTRRVWGEAKMNTTKNEENEVRMIFALVEHRTKKEEAEKIYVCFFVNRELIPSMNTGTVAESE